jgi:hypothetical protein
MLAEVAPLQVRSTVFTPPTLRPEALSVIGSGAGGGVAVGVGVGVDVGVGNGVAVAVGVGVGVGVDVPSQVKCSFSVRMPTPSTWRCPTAHTSQAVIAVAEESAGHLGA